MDKDKWTFEELVTFQDTEDKNALRFSVNKIDDFLSSIQNEGQSLECDKKIMVAILQWYWINSLYESSHMDEFDFASYWIKKASEVLEKERQATMLAI